MAYLDDHAISGYELPVFLILGSQHGGQKAGAMTDTFIGVPLRSEPLTAQQHNDREPALCCQVSLWVDERTAALINHAAKQIKRSRAYYMREAILERLARDGYPPA
jgi:Ribbon-helix-helix protein, copG family